MEAADRPAPWTSTAALTHHPDLLPPTPLIADAHALNLLVSTWTFRNEPQFLPRLPRRPDPRVPTFLFTRNRFGNHRFSGYRPVGKGRSLVTRVFNPC